MSEEPIESVLRTQGLFGLIRQLQSGSNDPIELAKRFAQTANDLYWKHHNVNAAVEVSDCGFNFVMAEAASSENAELLGHAKAIAYNLASFAWPGWGEPWAVLTPSEIALGSKAARLNLHLAVKLNKPAKAQAAAHWMVGAYAIVSKEWARAVESFERAAAFSDQANDKAGGLMHQGYAALTRLLESPQDDSAFNTSLDALRAEGSDDAKFYVDQLLTARKVFTAGV